MVNFTEIEFEKIFNNLYKDYTEQIEITEGKKAYLLGGQPGAGKSGLIGLLQENDNSLAVISGDDFRKYHPHFQELKSQYGDDYVLYTQEFIGKMTEALIKKLSDNGYNLIIEGTLRTIEVPLRTKTLLEEKGYQVELYVVQVKPEFSLLGTYQRYEIMLDRGTTGRTTPLEHHNNVVKDLPGNLSLLYNKKYFSNIVLYNRENECLYSMKNNPEIDPGTLIKKEFDRSLTKKEVEQLIAAYDKILEKMLKRAASVIEIESIKNEKSKISLSINLWAQKLEKDKKKVLKDK